MNSQSGRSLIEMLGVLALGAIITLGAYEMYAAARLRVVRVGAETDMQKLVDDIRLIYSGSKNYAGVSKTLLLKKGVKIEKIGGYDYSVRSDDGGKAFSVSLIDLNTADCAYYSTKKFDWSAAVAVNGFIGTKSSLCAEVRPNRLEFMIK